MIVEEREEKCRYDKVTNRKSHRQVLIVRINMKRGFVQVRNTGV